MTDEEEMEAVAAQEARLQFSSFSNDLGIDIGLAILMRAREERLIAAVDVRRNGHRLFHAATQGTSADNEGWINRKVATVNRFGHASLYMGAMGRAKGIDIVEKFALDPAQYTMSGGSFPILIKGTGPIGTVTVSGLPEREDHALVVWALEQHLR